MINLEYDVNTAGVRVSFVIRDSISSELLDAFIGIGRSDGSDGSGKRFIPQTVENLDVVRRILEAERDCERACELHATVRESKMK